MCVPLRAFSSFRIGSALQGVPWALPRPPLDPPRDPEGGTWTLRGIPGVFLAATASIFVSVASTSYYVILCTIVHTKYILDTSTVNFRFKHVQFKEVFRFKEESHCSQNFIT